MSRAIEQPAAPLAQRVLQIARDSLPDAKVIGAFQGMVRPAPWIVTVVPTILVIGVYFVLEVLLELPPLAGLAVVVISLVVVLLGFHRLFVVSALFAVTNKEIIVMRYMLGRTGEVIERVPRHVEVDRYWDARFVVVRVGDQRAFISRKLYAPLLQQLTG